MEPIEQIKVGDTVVFIKDLVSDLSFKRYTVEDIYECGEKTSPYHFAYVLQDIYEPAYRHEIYPVKKLPILKIRISDGERDTFENYIEVKKDYLETNKINIAISRWDSNLITVEFNFENIVDFYYLSADIGHFLQLDEKGIAERKELRLQDRVEKMKEEISYNKRWNIGQEANYKSYNDYKVDSNYDADGMRNDDEYNPKNWQGHDD